MKNYIAYNQEGKIQRTGVCTDDALFLQAEDSEFVIEGKANDVTQKVANPGVAGKIVDKTPEEIETEKPLEVSFEEQPVVLTNKQWQEALDRISVLESEA